MFVAWIAAVTAGAVQAPNTGPLRCTAHTLHSSRVSLDDVKGVIVLAPQPDTLKLSFAKRFDRPCASVVRKSVMGAIQLADGRAFQETSTAGTYEARDRQPF